MLMPLISVRDFGRAMLAPYTVSFALTLVRADALDRRRERIVRRAVDGPVLDLRARGILAEKVVALPVVGGPDRPRHETAAAIRAHVAEHALDARGAKGAF